MAAVEDYVDSFFEGLLDGNVKHAVVCPGSRSTPLVISLSQKKDRIRTWAMYDERSAAFFALGIAKSSLTPVALVATSGTAVANFLPAVVEAKLSRVPLVVTTADRPPEVRDFGAAQTIDQIRIYGSYTKFFQDMPIATEKDSLSLERYARIVGARAASIAETSPEGPVHVNFSFREPLIPAGQKPVKSSPRAIADDENHRLAISRAERYSREPDVANALREIKDGSTGVIIVGPENAYELKDNLALLSEVLGWPILADPLSNLRNMTVDGSWGLVRCYEALLSDKKNFSTSVNPPEWTIQLGGVPTSKLLNAFCGHSRKILLDDGYDWRDPSFETSSVIYGNYKKTLSQFTKLMKESKKFKPPDRWLRVWLDADKKALETTQLVLEKIDELFEGKLFFQLSKSLLSLAKSLSVVVGNSMPLRDLDAYYLEGSQKVRFVGNKGANGIDGLVSTALGISAVEGNVLLVLGDISFYHDMNGLLAAKLHGLNATIIVVNNRGGGIFSFLPQHELLSKETFEEMFGEAHDLDFSGAKKIYGGEFQRVSDWRDFDRVLSSSLETKGLKIIEFMAPDRETNLKLHSSTMDQICSAVGQQ